MIITAVRARCHSVTNIIIRHPTNCVAALIMVGRLLVMPCCSVETSFVIRLRISPVDVSPNCFCGTLLIFTVKSCRILFDALSVTVAMI